MNILLVAEKTKLPTILYGGMPRIVWSLAHALTQLGHKVSILCAQGSQCPFARIIERDFQKSIRAQVPDETDVVHFHSPVPTNFSLPYVETIHGNYNWNITPNAVFLSKNHAMRFGSNSFVYNGLDWDDAEYANPNICAARYNYHFLGKAAWRVKNVQGAIDVTKQMHGAHLDVIGGNRFNFHMGWRFTFSKQISFHGMCGGMQKRNLLSQSRGLIFPVMWHEPFGLAVIESLYFGAPVFCTPYGAMPEIVTPEVGAMENSVKAMAQVIEQSNFSPQICHQYARDMFSAMRMAQGYVLKYEIVLNGGTLNASLPCHVADEVPITWER